MGEVRHAHIKQDQKTAMTALRPSIYPRCVPTTQEPPQRTHSICCGSLTTDVRDVLPGPEDNHAVSETSAAIATATWTTWR